MLLKGGCVVNSDRKYLADVLIENNIIKQIGTDIVANKDVKVVNVSNMLILPGGIDPSTNFNIQADSKENFKKDSRLALEGGTTTIINHVSWPNGSSLPSAIQTHSTQMKGNMFCNFGFYVSLDIDNDNCIKDMKEIVQNHGVNCFEIKITSKVTKNVLSILKECSDLSCLIRIRLEDREFRDILEQNLIDQGVNGPDGFIQARMIEDEVGSLYHILKLNRLSPCAIYVPQVMNKEVADIISTMKKSGRSIFCETITAALAVDGERYYLKNWDEAAAVVTDPPFREQQTNELLKSLQNGDIDMLASQHTTRSAEERARGQKDFREIPLGVSGVKERMSILWDRGVGTGLIDECQFVAVTSTNAAKLFNLYPKKGHIAVGSIADLVIWNPQKNISDLSNGHRSNEINIYDGISCKGAPEKVILNGEIKYENSSIIEPPSGEKTDLKNNCRVVMDKMKLYQQRKDLSKVVVEHAYKNPLPVAEKESTLSNEDKDDKGNQKDGFSGKTQRPPTSSGNRNMQDSSFAFSGAQIDDDKPNRSSIRTNQPPGGKSSHIW